MRKRKKKKTNKLFLFRILLVILVLLGSCILAYKIYVKEKERAEEIIEAKNEEKRREDAQKEEERKRLEQEQALELKKEEIYNTCMNTPYKSENINTQIEKLKQEYQNKDLSFYFEDIINQYTIKQDETSTYFGASVIKLVEVLYLLNEAIAGRVDLSTPIKYESKHQFMYSIGMEKHQVGDEVPLKEVMEYAISVSDNSAHMMLFDFIGLEKIREFANSINVKTSISYSDKFGNLRAIDGYNILKEAYRILSLHNEYSEFLEKIMHNEYYNYLNFDDVEFLHKYGYSDRYYNDIGIYNGENPYLISVFTRYAYDDYQNIVKTLSKKIYNIYEQNFNEKKEYCNTQKENVTEN